MKNVLLALACFCFLFQIGCENQQNLKTVSPEDLKPVADDHDHDHVHKAPHDGHLIELGDHKYNAEIVYSANEPKLTFYILGAHAEAPVAIPDKEIKFMLEVDGAAKELVFKAEPVAGDKEGMASKFVLTDSTTLPPSITELEKMHGSLTLTINGENFTGNLTHTDHNHAGHDHAAHDHAEDKASSKSAAPTAAAEHKEHDHKDEKK